MAELDHRADDRHGVLAALHAADEALVDLQLVEGKHLQIAEPGIAGAEIVERDAKAGTLEAAQGGDGAILVDDQHALGDLQLDPPRIRLDRLDDRQQAGDEIRLAEIERGDVDRHRQVLPVARLDAGRAERPAAQIGDHAGSLGQRDEAGRRELTPCCGWFQRTSASATATRLLLSDSCGW